VRRGRAAGVPPAMQVNFTPVTGQYIRLRALSEINGHAWTSAAEINVLGAPPTTLIAIAAVSVNPGSVPSGSPSTGTVTLSAPAAAGGAVVTLQSGTPAAATVPASVTVAAGNSSATFTVSTSPVAIATQVSISGTYNGSAQATLTVNPPALSSVSLNPAIVLGGASSTGTVTLSAPAAAGGAVVTLSSSNPAVATVPASVSLPAGALTATFNVATNAGSGPATVNIGGNYNGSQSAMLTVTGLIAHTGWSVAYVDSQETSCYNGAATNAIDGKSSTMWHTQFCTISPPTPHEIQINLGASYSLTAFLYLPRQDGSSNGWIKDYEFYVSSDGVNWGTPVASGTFSYGAVKVPPAMQVNFTPVTGQYIRLRALSEINGHPWTSAAEINVLGH